MNSVATDLVQRTELRRQLVSKNLDAKHRSRGGDFFTPAPVARFLASLVTIPPHGTIRLHDPGAGVG
ncbi:MAG: SAM-dependent DNA methyltransferase, partial [Solirubrobacteraceae bacterium]